jgi:hypothetical protein
MEGIPGVTNASNACVISWRHDVRSPRSIDMRRLLPWYVRAMIGVVHAAVWACCLPVEWTGTPPAEWTGHRLPTEWTSLNKCRGGTPSVSGMDRRRALSAINAGAA